MAQAPVGINQPVKINGLKTDWTSLRGSWWGTGLTSSHLKSLNWDEMVTPTKPRGVHGIPLTRGLGFYTATASMAKYWCSDLQCKVMDECVQLFGGYGFMWEYPITRAYADARVQRIYGGTNEIMKEVITRSMGLAGK